MVDAEPKAPSRRQTHKAGEAPSRDNNDNRHVESVVERRPTEEPGTGDDRDDRERAAATGEGGAARGEGDSQIDPGVVAQRAAGFVGKLSGRRPESVISIERKDEEWRIGVEVVEVSRIPDTADTLAVYEVRLDAGGDLISYRRIRRYARGQLDSERQR